MSPDVAAFLPLLLVSPLLVFMAVGDLRNLRISNGLVLAMVAIFVVSAPFCLPLSDVGYRMAAAVVVFLLGLAGFAVGIWGGGDVKALTALALFLPTAWLSIYLYLFSASLAAGMILVFSLRAMVGSADTAWCSLRPNSGFPMGVSIGLSGLLLLPVVALTIH